MIAHQSITMNTSKNSHCLPNDQLNCACYEHWGPSINHSIGVITINFILLFHYFKAVKVSLQLWLWLRGFCFSSFSTVFCCCFPQNANFLKKKIRDIFFVLCVINLIFYFSVNSFFFWVINCGLLKKMKRNNKQPNMR